VWRSPFDRADSIIPIDPWVDRAPQGATSIEYSLWNHLAARVRSAGGGSVVRDNVFSVGIGQSYYSEATAGIDDPRYLTQTEGNFRPIWLTASVAPTDGFNGSFRMDVHPYTFGVQSYSASSRLRLKDDKLTLQAGWTKRNFLPGVRGYDNPALASHFLNGTVGVTGWNRRAGGSYGLTLDIGNSALIQQRFLVHYNAQCCGFAFDYQIISLGHLGSSAPAVDRRWNVSVTLAGIGSFSNPFGAFRQ
jgi:hypothetical protein